MGSDLCITYTRHQLAQSLGISLNRVRRLLKKCNVHPVQQKLTDRSRPIYLYDAAALQHLKAQIQQKAQTEETRKCCICKKAVYKHKMVGSRCLQCYVRKCCVPIMYGKEWWNKTVNSQAVQIAIRILQAAIPGSM